MNSLIFPASIIKRPTIVKNQLYDSGFWKVPKQQHCCTLPDARFKSLPLRCTKFLPWDASSQYAPRDVDGIIEGSNMIEPIETENTQELPVFQSENDVVNVGNQTSLLPQPLKWPMWLLGPSVLLATGMVPTLWLPLSSVFLGANIAGLLSLVGLDCIFNMGATLFLLMADACAHPKGNSTARKSQVPFTYKLWNLGASLVGLIVPLVLLFASYRGSLQPHVPFISFAVLLGPYLLLLSIQMLTEMLTWHWKSPVWLMTPIVYESYRILQLVRGLKLVNDVGAPSWAMESLRWLVSWWVLILGVQLMRVAWFAGSASQTRQQL